MRHVLFVLALLFLAGCGPSTDTPAISDDSAISDNPTDADSERTPMVLTALQDSLFALVPEIAECREQLLSDGSGMAGEPVRHQGFANIIEIPCGPAPGTGAYGYPMSIVVEYPASEFGLEGPVERLLMPMDFFDRDPTGAFVPSGFVTQAIPWWNADDLGAGRIHLLYKYAGAGHCGMLVTYETQGARADFTFWEVREQTCDSDAANGSVDPREWDVVFTQ